MLYNYQAITNTGEKKTGSVEAGSKDLAIAAIQRRGFIISSIKEANKNGGGFELSFLGKKNVPMKDIVIMSRQMSTLFESQVSALKAFNLLSENTSNKRLARIMNDVAEDIKGGVYISVALSKHKEAFSDFYVNMIKSGEESGKLTQSFSYLADYLDRQYQLSSKTKNALIYPSFVIGVFGLVLIAMFTFIIPKLADIIKESNAAIPLSTKIIMKISDIFVNYWMFLLAGVVVAVVFIVRFASTKEGKIYFDRLKITMPVIRNIYAKLYLSRIADNMDTMLSSSIPIVRSIELTSAVVGNIIFENILKEIAESVKSGSSLSDAFSKHKEIPSIMHGMIRVGEETGSLGNILKTLGRFYSREVNEAVDTMVSLIEPIMIVALGIGVGILLSSVLMPIYNIAGSVG
jgi:type IV pilus assembly protein PilC